MKALQRFAGKQLHVVYRFDGPTPDLPALPERMVYIRLSQAEIDQFFGSDPKDLARRRTYTRLLRQGCIGMLIADGSKWASVGWISHSASVAPPHLSRSIIGADSLWTFYVHTHVSYRGQGLQKAGLAYRIQLAREASGNALAPVYNDVAVPNIASRKAQLRVGFEPAGVIASSWFRVPKLHTWYWGVWHRDYDHPSWASS